MKQKTEKKIEKISETKSWSFEKINNIANVLTGMIKKRKKDDTNFNIINETEDISIYPIDIKQIIRKYYK